MKKQVKFLQEEKRKELKNFIEKEECTKAEVQRVQSILMIDKGLDAGLIKEITGLDKKYASALRKKYIERGIESLISKRKKKVKSLLTKSQREELIAIIKTKKPSEFGYDSDFWITLLLGDFIEKRYGVKYKSRTSLYLIFKESHFSYHKPETKYKKKDEAREKEWIKENKNRIDALLQEENTVVFTADEMILSTQTTTQKIWLPKGEYPKIDVAVKRDRRIVYGFFNPKTGKVHAFKTKYANSENTCLVLEKLASLYPGKKIVIIWDNASWHRSQFIKDFLSKTSHNFFLIQFPPWAPELNPQEHVWKAGRSAISHNVFIKNIDDITDSFIDHLNSQLFNYKFL